ncbi:MAG: phage tail protein [Gammaproteobacteria bacterium]|nr:phage tail protein [Gammaproteobacteria bacterium]
MATSSDRRDPFTAFRFEVRIDDMVTGGFSECSGLQLDMEVCEYREGGLNDRVHKFPSRTRQANLILRRGMVDRELYDWYRAFLEGNVRLRSGVVRVLDESGTHTALAWGFKAGFPCRWVGPDLDAAHSRVAVETLEICHDGLHPNI